MVPEVGTGRPDEQDRESIPAFAGKVVDKLESGSDDPVKVPGNYPYKDGMGMPVTPLFLPSCKQCGKCSSVCPAGAIQPENDVSATDPEKCILCMACVHACPEQARILPLPLQSDAVIFGTPVYFTSMSWELKKWFDHSFKINLSGKLGAAFVTAQSPMGGADTAIMEILRHMLLKGMFVFSGTGAGHTFQIGAVGIAKNREASAEQFEAFGENVAQAALKLFGQRGTGNVQNQPGK